MSPNSNLLVRITLILLFPAILFAVDVGGMLSENTTWAKSESPFHIVEDVEVAPGAQLTIEPGVEIHFDADIGIIVSGLLIARGTENDSILFTSAGVEQSIIWSGIMFSGGVDEPIWDSDGNYIASGSVLEYCILESAGSNGLIISSTIAVDYTAFHLANSTVRNCAGVTGTIRCGNMSNVLIENCMIVNNRADRGGAISLGLSSRTVVRNNTIAQNQTMEHGGAIYMYMANSNIAGNSFLNNTSKGYGSAIYMAISGDIVLGDNLFFHNRANVKAPIMFLTDRVENEITTGVWGVPTSAIYVHNKEIVLKTEGNWWDKPKRFDPLTTFKKIDPNRSEPKFQYQSILWGPPLNVPTNPKTIYNIRLCRDTTYTEEIPHGVAEGAPMRIRLEAVDVNPYVPDVIQVKVISEKKPEGILIPLVETGANSGVFMGRGRVEVESDQTAYAVGSDIRGQVELFCEFASDTRVEYATMSAKPMTENLAIPAEKNIRNIVGHKPTLTWKYFEVVERPQTHYHIKVFSMLDTNQISASPVWDSGEVESEDKEVTYAGPRLEDGTSYLLRLSVYSSYLWSDPVEFAFRMNSLPTVPVILSPAENELTATLNPEIVIGISTDPEFDLLTYDFEIISTDDPSTPFQSIEAVKPGQDQVKWLPEQELVENKGYELTARAVDPYEKGQWSEHRPFWINSKEETPAPFDLKSPINEVTIYQLHPDLIWNATFDPDPLSSVKYNVDVSKAESFSEALSYSDIKDEKFNVPDSLDNRTTYYWRVTAIDNTGRTTQSGSVGRFYVDTTPSIPVMKAPLAGQERLPETRLTWETSTDPDPEDIVIYDIEVYSDIGLSEKAASLEGFRSTALPVNEINGWEELIDNQVYFWRVRARDNHNAGSKFSIVGSFFFNRYNDPPDPVTKISALVDTVMDSNDIRFAWTEASDPDLSDSPETLIYEVEATLTDFEAGNVRRFETKPGITKITYQLDDNRLWRYRIRVRDDESKVSPWSVERTVLVNVDEDPPASFTLNTPVNDHLVVELDSLLLTWQASSDPDWKSTIHYRLEIFPRNGEVFSVELTETQYHYKEGLKNESGYRWRVTAIDNTGLMTAADAEFQFITNTTPTAPVPASMQEELLPGGLIAFIGAQDPNPNDRLIYTLDIDVDRIFVAPIVSVENIPHNYATITTVIGDLEGADALEDDRDYYFQVLATDNHGYAGPYSMPHRFRFNRENDSPGTPPGPFAPSQDKVVRDQSPEVSWSAASDEDLSDPPERLAYDIRLDLDGELEQNSMFQFATPPNITTYKIPAPLQDNKPWVWQVRTRDDEGALSEWSPVQSILINVAEDPPTPSTPFKPFQGQRFNILGPVDFGWSPSVDLDYQSSVTYRVEYSTNEDFSNAAIISDLDTTISMTEGQLENTTYHWRVTTIDNTGLETVSSPASFTLDTRPSVPQQASPTNRVEVLPDGILRWNPSVDPNPQDKIEYSVQIATGPDSDAGRAERVTEKAGITGTSIALSAAGWDPDAIITAFGDNLVCHWRVKATDEHVIASEWSAPVEFIFNGRNEPPNAVEQLTGPAEGSEVATVTLTWKPTNDPDPSDTPDKLSYRIELAMDREFSGDIRTIEAPAGVSVASPFGLIDNSRWFWRMVVVDDEGLTSAKSPVGSFIYNRFNDPPTEFYLQEPAMKVSIESPEITFRWSASTDLDIRDRITYTLITARDPAFSLDVKQYPNISGLEHKPPASAFTVSGVYFWKVMVDDGKGGVTWGSGSDGQPWSFTLKLPAPEPVGQ